MKICIGIISYLPDTTSRDIRQKKLLQLIDACNKFFSLPIIIIAQNGKDFTITKYSDLYNVNKCNIYYYDKPLGIIEARRELRKNFLKLDYDYIIMLDDDCTISCPADSAKKYIEQIEEHPGMFGLFNGTLLKLFAISKDIFKEVDFKEGKVEDGDFFEDILFVETLKKLYKDKMFQFNKNGLSEKSNNFNDEHSTGYHGQFNKHDIGNRTRAILKEL